MELRREGENGATALFELRGDVHDEGRSDGSEGSGVENFERAVRLAFDGKLLQAGKEAAFIAEGGGVVVIGVASFPVRKNHSFRAEIANDGGEPELVLAGRLSIGIGDAQRATPTYAKELGGFGGFFGAGFGSTASAHFARRQIEDAGLVAEVGHF